MKLGSYWQYYTQFTVICLLLLLLMSEFNNSPHYLQNHLKILFELQRNGAFSRKKVFGYIELKSSSQNE